MGGGGGSSWKQKMKFFLLLSHDLFCPHPPRPGGTYCKRLYAKRGFGFGRQKRKGKEEEERGGEGSKNPALKKIGVPTSNSFVKPRSELYDPSLSHFFGVTKRRIFKKLQSVSLLLLREYFWLLFLGVIIIIFGCQVRRGRRGVHMGFWDGLVSEKKKTIPLFFFFFWHQQLYS